MKFPENLSRIDVNNDYELKEFDYMRITPIKIEQQNQLINDYHKENHHIHTYFDYQETEEDIRNRIDELMDRSFKRKQLADVLTVMNERWGAPESTIRNINRLRGPDSVVVIGGQQAGLLTGPLYTIHKIISIITYAKQKEREYDRPVIPVFWIAGEDHDFLEVNHVHMLNNDAMTKVSLDEQPLKKIPISNMAIDHEKGEKWLRDVFSLLKETRYTKGLYLEMHEALRQSHTFVDFFARALFTLIQEEGLVLVDSGATEIRQLESDYFVQLINNQKEISTKTYMTHKQLLYKGYSIDLDLEEQSGHLFYHHENERILLFRDEKDNWVGKQHEVSLSNEELLFIAKKQPYLLSNNVVTRPVMQDLLFPTLAFIGGPGEISYWSVLKGAFHALDIKMPPVIKRLSFTLVTNQVQGKLEKYGLSLINVIENGTNPYKQMWLQSQSYPPVHEMFKQLKNTIQHTHQPIHAVAQEIRKDLGALAENNLQHIYRHIDYLEQRMNHVLEEQLSDEMADFDYLMSMLYPNQGFQERIWNPLPWLNEYGIDLIHNLLKQNLSLQDEHYIVHL
ncbi:MAG TPA: bacillithiol biosynthesis cysteine-adding enzyme BshC [Cerasibacillus sp.]|uniref:bacillithiol biosynthesis cysteine-adding enzyme BshC n=1 Tax=Cerasibacillus sp. TaxID=2498711 RepID=UPI002F3FAE62